MRKIYLFLIILVSAFNSNSQALDSASATRIMERSNKPIVTALESQTKLIKDSVVTKRQAGEVIKMPLKTGTANFISFLPVGFFFLILILVLIKLRKDKVKLSELLLDKDIRVELRKQTASVMIADAQARKAIADALKVNPNAGTAFDKMPFSQLTAGALLDTDDPAEPQKSDQSVSRLIAFICGVTSVGLAACITTFYFYRSFTVGGEISIGNLANVLYGLGLGVLPYGFNKIAAAIK